MRLLTLLTASLFSIPVPTSAQVADSVATILPFGSADNRIDFTVANTDDRSIDGVVVRLADAPAWLTVRPTEVVVGGVDPGSDVVASFALALAENAPVDEVRGVRFVVSADGSSLAERSFQLVVAAPPEVTFHPNYPNPFRSRTSVGYELPTPASVHLSAFDILGRRVAEWVEKEEDAGYHEVDLDLGRLAPGLYVLRLVVDAEDGRTEKHQRITVVH